MSKHFELVDPQTDDKQLMAQALAVLEQSTQDMVELGREVHALRQERNALRSAGTRFLHCIDNITSGDFALGADRQTREQFRAVLKGGEA